MDDHFFQSNCLCCNCNCMSNQTIYQPCLESDDKYWLNRKQIIRENANDFLSYFGHVIRTMKKVGGALEKWKNKRQVCWAYKSGRGWHFHFHLESQIDRTRTSDLPTCSNGFSDILNVIYLHDENLYCFTRQHIFKLKQCRTFQFHLQSE